MWRGGLVVVACGLLALAASSAPTATRLPGVAERLQDRLSDAEFRRLVVQLSEPDGYFDSDNLVSNEDTFQTVIPALVESVAPGGVYLGVGPDQNFSYIVATRPRLAFIADVRRGNLLVHLMYKALFELSADRAEFLSRLFSRPRPSGVSPQSSVEELFSAYRTVSADRALYDANLRQVVSTLSEGHGLALDASDRAGIDAVYANFFAAGPALRFVSSRGGNRYPSFEDLQVATDGRGVHRGYLASETWYRELRAMQQGNAIVPVVGNFAGPTALRGIGSYLRARGATVSVFYTSNVERYLFQDRVWATFMANVASLPIEDASTFVRSCFDSCSDPGGSRSVTLLDSIPGLLRDVAAGRVTTYSDVLYRRPGR